MKQTLEMIEQEKKENTFDFIEYDFEKREIRFANNNPNIYKIPPHWEDSLVKVGGNLYYGLLTVNAKK